MLKYSPLWIVLVNSVLLAAGILLVLVACFQYSNFFPFLTIIINTLAVLQLMICGACSGNDDDAGGFGDHTEYQYMAGVQLSWWIFGMLIVMGYAIPSLSYRAGDFAEVALYLTWGGGTIIVTAMIVYMKLLYKEH